MKIRGSISVLIIICMLVGILSGCGGDEKQEQSRVEETKLPEISYDEEMKTLIIQGTDNIESVEISDEIKAANNVEVTGDTFKLNIYLPIIRNLQWDEQIELPGLIERTDKSLSFIREYLRDNAGVACLVELLEKPVVIDIEDKFEYTVKEDVINLKMHTCLTHREVLYLLALINTDSVGWEQIGYAWYVGTCINPYSELAVKNPITEELGYYRECIEAGINPNNFEYMDVRTMYNACSKVALEKGLTHWGSWCESTPVTSEYVFTRKNKTEGDSVLSAFMAASFLGWLDDNHGFENVSMFCFGKKSFVEAFGKEFETAFEEWKDWIVENY